MRPARKEGQWQSGHQGLAMVSGPTSASLRVPWATHRARGGLGFPGSVLGGIVLCLCLPRGEGKNPEATREGSHEQPRQQLPGQLSSLPTQTTSSSLKRTSSSQGSGMTIPSSQAVSTQPSSTCPLTSTISSGSLPLTRSAAVTPASRPSATEPAGHVST